MTQFKLSLFVLLSASLLISALPLESDKEKDVVDIRPVILEAIELPAEQATVTETKPILEEKPSTADESSAPSSQSTEEPSSPQSDSYSSPASSSSESKPTAPTLIDLIPSQDLTPPPRRVIQYDQRQDGKYNIRADLENFVVLVVPSSGFSLLDLLRRSNSHHHKRAHGKHHKKFYGSPSKAEHDPSRKDSNRLDYLRPEPSDLVDTHPAAPAEFIEGRTPYHVDISSSEIRQAALQPLTKTLPTVLRSLLIEPLSIADLPLSDDPSVVVDDAPAVLLPAQMKGNEFTRALRTAHLLTTQHRHQSKSLTSADAKAPSINSNSVLLTPIQTESNQHEIGTVVNGGNGNGSGDVVLDLMQPEFIDLTDTRHSFDSLNVDSIDRLASSDTKSSSDSQWELTLLGAEEQCGPDRRRDSYGICQFVPKDYIH